MKLVRGASRAVTASLPYSRAAALMIALWSTWLVHPIKAEAHAAAEEAASAVRAYATASQGDRSFVVSSYAIPCVASPLDSKTLQICVSPSQIMT